MFQVEVLVHVAKVLLKQITMIEILNLQMDFELVLMTLNLYASLVVEAMLK